MLSLTMLLTSCGIAVPGSLVKDCAVPYAKEGTLTNKDVVDLAIDREYAIKQCNVQLEGVRVFIRKHPKLRIDKDT